MQGEWVFVVVDDWIFCEVRGKLVFVISRKGNEFWVFILEKVYVKLYGFYEVLEGGQVYDVFVDLMGGVGEEIDLINEVVQLDFVSGYLWFQL